LDEASLSGSAGTGHLLELEPLLVGQPLGLVQLLGGLLAFLDGASELDFLDVV
jgi:hypothetical protein